MRVRYVAPNDGGCASEPQHTTQRERRRDAARRDSPERRASGDSVTEVDRDRLILATANAVAQLMAQSNGLPDHPGRYSETQFRQAQRLLISAMESALANLPENLRIQIMVPGEMVP